MELPKFLRPFKESAERHIAKKRVKDIEFSGKTYQVLVADLNTDEEVWAFLQLDEQNKIKDCFCSCQDTESISACAHLATAFLYIYGDYPIPIHLRFERSFWNQLCRQHAHEYGYDPSLIKYAGNDTYTLGSVFQAKGMTQAGTAHLREIFLQRPQETEETSLKFSDLPQEEIYLWREGRPSFSLRYELSFWADFAKWLTFLQENQEPYTLSFEHSEEGIPCQVTITFPDVTCIFALTEASLPVIIPALKTVDSPLQVHEMEQKTIEKIVYDEEMGSLNITTRGDSEQETTSKGIPIEGWSYVKGDGFYARKQHQLLAMPQLKGSQITQALNEHLQQIKPLLRGTLLHEIPVEVHYTLAFDDRWDLHIASYLKTPGDLQHPHSRNFGEWVYLEGNGFYRLDTPYFEKTTFSVPKEEIANFISQHRTWFNTQEGFHTYAISMETQTSYTLNKANQLTFHKTVIAQGKTEDFGPWTYVEGRGFYSKASPQIGLPVRSDVPLNASQIPLFIRQNREELLLVPGFFSRVNPIQSSTLKIELSKEGIIQVTPHHEKTPGYEEKALRFFDHFVFVEGEGFHELPHTMHLPERYQQPVKIVGHDMIRFLLFELESLKQHASSIDHRLLYPKEMQLAANSIAKKEKGLYALDLAYRTENGTLSIQELHAAIKAKKRLLFSEAGLIDVQQRRFNWIKLLEETHPVTLSTLKLLRLNAFDSISFANPQDAHLLNDLLEFRTPKKPDLSGLKSTLRPYQEIGLHWLWFLYHHRLSGLLCDDMGLGKTHQAMALLAAIINYKRKPAHYLVICPTSVIYHWQEKLEAFLPGLRICTFHGSQRSFSDFKQEYDLLLTSYGIWRREHQLLSKVPFEVAIFDEIQIAKNSSSITHISLKQVSAKMCVGLTGTPIENNLRELKALFDLVLPTYMPGETEFREIFIKPIEQQQNKEKQELLARFINPFVLRRKKEEVLVDLPEKTEEIAHCELSDQQNSLYTEVLERRQRQIIHELHNQQEPIPYIHIFALLSSLKQICNHPAAYLKTPEKYQDFSSGKWSLFKELLWEARESKQKVVIFSQYLMMLDIIENYLNAHHIGFAKLRGATMNRGEEIQRFKNDPSCEVFVASLRAAGLGIDLTAASVVIHYDRWWNAAREDQATDRVHRIGQSRGVQVFKLVTKNTFEEKIDALIAKKGKLMEGVISSDDHHIIKQFTRDELIELLRL